MTFCCNLPAGCAGIAYFADAEKWSLLIKIQDWDKKAQVGRSCVSAVTLCVLKTRIVSRLLLRFLLANQKPVCFLGDFLPLPPRVLRSMETNAAWIEGSQAPAEGFCSLQRG